MGLADWQTSFQKCILNKNETLQISQTHQFDSKRRLSVYQDAYEIRLLNSLTDDFESLVSYLGENDFNQILRSFVNQSPSKTYNLGEYSVQFLKWLSAHKNYQFPLIYDIAKWDLNWILCNRIKVNYINKGDLNIVGEYFSFTPKNNNSFEWLKNEYEIEDLCPKNSAPTFLYFKSLDNETKSIVVPSKWINILDFIQNSNRIKIDNLTKKLESENFNESETHSLFFELSKRHIISVAQ